MAIGWWIEARESGDERKEDRGGQIRIDKNEKREKGIGRGKGGREGGRGGERGCWFRHRRKVTEGEEWSEM